MVIGVLLSDCSNEQKFLSYIYFAHNVRFFRFLIEDVVKPCWNLAGINWNEEELEPKNWD